MDDRTARFLTVDLDLAGAPADVAVVVRACAGFAFDLHADAPGRDPAFATLELTGEDGGEVQPATPADGIERFCAGLERLDRDARAAWDRLEAKVLHPGFDSGIAPHHRQWDLPAPLLARVAALGASLAVSIYAVVADEDASPPSG